MCGAVTEQQPADELSTPTTSQIKDWASKVSKLLFVLGCYTSLFYVIIRQALWFLRGWESGNSPVALIDWVQCLPECNPLPKDVVKSLSWNIMLFFLFVAQHSLLAERNLSGTFIHQKLFIEWKINGSLYTLATAAVLHVMTANWVVVPIYVWKLPIVQPICNIVHFIAWLSLYGTTLMQDMPELVGLNQVVFANNANSVKSEEFKAMLKKQRHLGFIPFAVLILVCRVMTLDRMLYLVVLLLYSYKMWQDPDSYDYIKEMTCRKRTRLSGGNDKIE